MAAKYIYLPTEHAKMFCYFARINENTHRPQRTAPVGECILRGKKIKFFLIHYICNPYKKFTAFSGQKLIIHDFYFSI
jgi:hypothetical protein